MTHHNSPEFEDIQGSAKNKSAGDHSAIDSYKNIFKDNLIKLKEGYDKYDDKARNVIINILEKADVPKAEFSHLSRIIYDVEEEEYSEIAKATLLLSNAKSKTSYTILALSPKEVYSELFKSILQIDSSYFSNEEFERKMFELHDSPELSNNFYKKIYERYSHFGWKPEDKIQRIILELTDHEQWMRENLVFLYFFLIKLNRDIPCYKISNTVLNTSHYALKEDYVLFNDEIGLVYFPKSKTLNFQYLPARDEKPFKFLKEIPTLIKRKKIPQFFPNTNKEFSELEIKITEIRRYFQKSGKSLLYHGYEHADKIDSIIKQRDYQVEIMKKFILEDLKTDTLVMLSVGCAFGGEIKHFVRSGTFDKLEEVIIIAIDNSEEIDEENVSKIEMHDECPANIQINYLKFDLLDTPVDLIKRINRELSLNSKILEFDIVQCGFVLEDIDYNYKPDAFKNLHQLTRKQGLLIVSEMFLNNKKIEPCISLKDQESEEKRKANIIRLYSSFFAEAIIKLNVNSELNDLFKNSKELGLLRCLIDSLNGVRDYFQDQATVSNELIAVGFDFLQDESFWKKNELGFKKKENDMITEYFLQVLSFKKT